MQLTVNKVNRILKFLTALLFFFIFQINVSAKSYTIDQILVNAEILPDGSIQITEARTYTFNGKFTWADYKLPLEKLGNIRIFSIREGSQKFYESQDERPGSYYTEMKDHQFYARWFYLAEDESRTFVINYYATDVVTVYNDIAEFYYKFIGEANEKEIGYFEAMVKLPELATQDSVKIWAHGPLHGLTEIDNGNIKLSINPMPPKNYFESRIVFPAEWVPDALKVINSNHMETVLAQEKEWVENANKLRELARKELAAKRENEQQAYPIAIALSIIGFIVIYWLYRKYGKAFEVPYTLDVDSTIPRNTHPAILCCLYNNKQVHGGAISTTLFDLANRDLIAIEQVEHKDRKWWQPKSHFEIKLNRAGWIEIYPQMKNFENNLLRFFFDDIGGGKDVIKADLFRKESTKVRKWFIKWKKILKPHFKKVKLYEKKSISATIFAAIVSFAINIGGILILVFLGFPGIIALASGLICFALSFSILRYTEEMKLRRVKWEALRQYIKKYHFLDESDLSWQNQIGDYLVYGIALGVSKKAIEKMVATIPVDRHGVHFPWYIYAPGTFHSPAEFAQAITSVVSVATTTVSSAAGAGGGATGGGGGGAGGASGGAG